jgi:hypothetical protein
MFLVVRLAVTARVDGPYLNLTVPPGAVAEGGRRMQVRKQAFCSRVTCCLPCSGMPGTREIPHMLRHPARDWALAVAVNAKVQERDRRFH